MQSLVPSAAESGPIRLSFNPQLRVEFRGATVTSDAGLLLPRELDERLGVSAPIERHLTGSRERRETSVALTSTLHWLETAVLAEDRPIGRGSPVTVFEPTRRGCSS